MSTTNSSMIPRKSTAESEADRRYQETRVALAELEASRLIDGDEMLAWIDCWGVDDEPDPRFVEMP